MQFSVNADGPVVQYDGTGNAFQFQYAGGNTPAPGKLADIGIDCPDADAVFYDGTVTVARNGIQISRISYRQIAGNIKRCLRFICQIKETAGSCRISGIDAIDLR